MGVFSQMQNLGFLFNDKPVITAEAEERYRNKPGDLELYKETQAYLREQEERSIKDDELRERLDEKAQKWKGVNVQKFVDNFPKEYTDEERRGIAELKKGYDPNIKTKEEKEYEKRYAKNLNLANKLYQKEIQMEKLMGGKYPNPLYPSTLGHSNKKISDILDHYALGAMQSKAAQGYIPSSKDLGMGDKNIFLAPKETTGLGVDTRDFEKYIEKQDWEDKDKKDKLIAGAQVPWGMSYGPALRDENIEPGIFTGIEYRDAGVDETSKYSKFSSPLIEYYKKEKGWSSEQMNDETTRHELVHRAMTTSGFFPRNTEGSSYLKEHAPKIDWNDPFISSGMNEILVRAYTNKLVNNGKLDLEQFDLELVQAMEDIETRKLIVNEYMPLLTKGFDNYLSGVGTTIDRTKINELKKVELDNVVKRDSQLGWLRKHKRPLPKTKIEKIKINRPIRNHNPFNLNYTTIKWEGKLPMDKKIEKRFERFDSPLMGMRAGIINTLTHHIEYGDDTITKLITRHAPPNENNTKAFIKKVARDMGLDPDEKINLKDSYILSQYAEAVVDHEGFYHYFGTSLLIDEAIDLAYKQKNIP